MPPKVLRDAVTARYRQQRAEWLAIQAEMTAAARGGCVTAIDVTREQIRRLGERGERRVTLTDLQNE